MASNKNADGNLMSDADNDRLNRNMESLSKDLMKLLSVDEDEYQHPNGHLKPTTNYFIPEEQVNYNRTIALEAVTSSMYMPALSLLEGTPLLCVRATKNANKQHRPTNSSNINNNRRNRFRKNNAKQNTTKYSYDEITIDYKLLGISKEGINVGAVEQLFQSLEDCHYAIDELLPTERDDTEGAFVATFCSTLNYCRLDHTLGVCVHIHRLEQKIDNFLNEIVAITQSKCPNVYKECQKYIWDVQETTRTLAGFHQFQFEHKDGKFISEECESKAKLLEASLRKAAGEIRLLRLHFVANYWYECVQRGVLTSFVMGNKNTAQSTTNSIF